MPEPAPLPPPIWAPQDVQELLTFIQSVGAEGLDPRDYDPAGLTAALASRNPMAISQAASDRFNRLADDLALGHVRGNDRVGWSIVDPDLGTKRKDQPLRPDQLARLDQIMRTAVAQHNVTATLAGLLPKHPQYAMLKKALAITPATETSKINRIRLNLDRWRWLPRDLGDRYIIANVPAYTAALVENGDTISRHYAVAGKVTTPTPQLSAIATGVILNPWWEVPKSIEPEVRGKAGYVAGQGQGRQGPALAPAAGAEQRARQGQVRDVQPAGDLPPRHQRQEQVQQPHARVQPRLHPHRQDHRPGDDPADPGRDRVDARKRCRRRSPAARRVQANFPKPLPVYIIYMSSAATVDGRIIDYPDVYSRDAKAIAALLDTKTGGAATRTAAK